MVPSTVVPAPGAAADEQVDQALRQGAVAFNQKRPTREVGFVAAFVLGGAPAIAQAWRPILRPAGLSIRVTGVFIHQNPYVDFTVGERSGLHRDALCFCKGYVSRAPGDPLVRLLMGCATRTRI